MSTKSSLFYTPLLCGIALTAVGCIGTPSDHPIAPVAISPAANRASDQKKTLQRVTNRPANTLGSVFIAEYHQIRAGKGEMFRSVAQFRNDLETYYKLGFRPVLASEYLTNKMPLAPGASPIVITFDDSTPTQLQLRKDGSVDPNCAVGIWESFAKLHPDFPVHATFYVLPDQLWTHGKSDSRKSKLVLDLGCELANHTMTHPQLRRLTDDRVKSELGTANDRLSELGQSLPVSMALPFGLSPKNRNLVKGFDWNGRHVTFTGVFLSGAEPAKSPNDPKFSRYRVARILATTVPYGMDYWLARLKEAKVKPFIQP